MGDIKKIGVRKHSACFTSNAAKLEVNWSEPPAADDEERSARSRWPRPLVQPHHGVLKRHALGVWGDLKTSIIALLHWRHTQASKTVCSSCREAAVELLARADPRALGNGRRAVHAVNLHMKLNCVSLQHVQSLSAYPFNIHQHGTGSSQVHAPNFEPLGAFWTKTKMVQNQAGARKNIRLPLTWNVNQSGCGIRLKTGKKVELVHRIESRFQESWTEPVQEYSIA